MPRMIGGAAAAFVLLFAAHDAAAQTQVPMLKVVRDSATVHARPELLSEEVGKVEKGATLEAIDREDDWYWVVMPADEHGTKYSGWIRAHDVDIVAAGDPSSVLKHFAEAVQQAKDREEKEAAEQEARLDAARQRVEDARREYEAVVQKGSTGAAPAGSPAPAPAVAPPVPTASKTAPVQLPKSDKPQAPVTRRYQFFGGYSFYHDGSDSVSFPAGWEISGSRPVTPKIDFVGAISGSHRSDDAFGVTVASANLFTFTAGPKYARRIRNFTAFAQVLFGVATLHGTTSGVSDSSTGFTMQPGGGIDYPLTNALGVRVGMNIESMHLSGGWVNGFRFTTGITFVPGGSATK